MIGVRVTAVGQPGHGSQFIQKTSSEKLVRPRMDMAEALEEGR